MTEDIKEKKGKEKTEKKKDKFDEAIEILEEYEKGTPPRKSSSNDWGE